MAAAKALSLRSWLGCGDYAVTADSVTFNGVSLLEMKPEERARAGVFLAFHAPGGNSGVNSNRLPQGRLSMNAARRRGEQELDAKSSSWPYGQEKDHEVARTRSGRCSDRAVNEGFSGGEKKRNEIFQMAVLEPKLAILDETDSGLDIDALRIVSGGVNKLRRPDNATPESSPITNAC